MDIPEMARPLTLLVVDDNPDVAESLAAILRLAGHEVRAELNGLDALDAAREAKPDVVILDLGMPSMNGFEAAHRFRQDESIRPAMLIALTAWGSEDDRRRTKAAGFDHHLVKPVDPSEVVSLLHNHAWERMPALT